MRILIPLRGRLVEGGIRTYERALAPALYRHAIERGDEVFFAVWKDDRETLAEVSGFAGAAATIPLSRKPGLLADQWTVPRLARRLRADLVFNPLHTAPVLGRFRKVMVIHGPDFYMMPHTMDLFNRIKWTIADRLAMPHTDLLVFVSETQRRDFLGVRRFPRERTLVVHSGVDPRFRPLDRPAAAEHVRRRFGIEGPFVLFVGHLFPIKNAGRTLEAFARIADRIPHRFVLAGGDRWGADEDRQRLERLAETGRARALGRVDPQDLVALYGAADLLVAPSLYESLSLTLLEALACGCPVVTARRGGIPEVVGACAVFVDPEDVTDIARGMLRVIEDPQLARQLREQGPRRAARFTWDAAADRLLEAFHRLAEAPAGPPRPEPHHGHADPVH